MYFKINNLYCFFLLKIDVLIDNILLLFPLPQLLPYLPHFPNLPY